MIASNALTLLATVKDELGITVTTYDAVLERMIATISGAIEKFCRRSFSYAAVANERHRPSGLYTLVLDRTPLVSLTSVTVNDEAVDMGNVTLEDAGAGVIRRDDLWWRFEPTVARSIAQDPYAGMGEPWILANYKGGYVPQGTTWAASTTFPAGGFVRPVSGTNLNVFQAGASGTTHGTTEPTWPAAGLTVADNGVTWTNVGPRTLPYDLEQACIDGVVSLYRQRGTDGHIASEALGDASVSYRAVNTAIGTGSGGMLPDHVLAQLAAYRRIAA